MTRKTLAGRLLALLVALTLIAAACGSDSDSGSEDTGSDTTSAEGDEEAAETQPGGDFTDLGTFVGDPPEHIDPALNVTLDAYQVVNAMYDGLTDIDSSDPANPVIVPDVAESYEVNDDATVWTFTIREGEQFSNGEAILPSTFKASWERAARLAGDYSYLMGFIEGGEEALGSETGEIPGVVADDDAMTLEVTLSDPYANFDAVAGFQLFFPMPSEATDLTGDEAAEYENGIMVGNGPYLQSEPRTDEQIVLAKNDEYDGNYEGETFPDRLDTITFVTTADPDTAYNSFEAGEGNDANIPPARTAEAQENYGTTLDVAILGSYHYDFNLEDPTVGGDENKLFRQAVSQAIDRDEINEAVYSGSRTVSTGITPEGIPGFQPDICDYCAYDPEAAQAAFDEWTAAGNEQAEPMPIQFNRDAGHEPVAQIMVDNLAAIGIDAVAEPMDSETYFSDLAEGACVFCRSGWFADYPTYDNFMYDLFHSDSLGGNNYGFDNAEFDSIVDEAKATTDKDAQAELFVQAESILLNDEIGAVPINWYRGDYVYSDDVAVFPQTNFGLILWEQVAFAA